MAHPPFNPLDKVSLGESVANALLRRPLGPLPPIERFAGAGVYAIYYLGANPLYRAISLPVDLSGSDEAIPIYVGKAVPAGSRKGGFGLGLSPGNALFRRLSEHASSIQEVETPALSEFLCRYLIADDIWIPLGESLLIGRFQPVWNVLITGFGNHDQGGNRSQQIRSSWDTLHPGRPWATLLKDNPRRKEELENLIQDYWAGKAKPTISTAEATLES